MTYLKTTFPYLLVQKGKHGDSYYHVDSPEAFNKALLSIFTMQNENGYYSFNLEEQERGIYLKEQELKKLEDLYKTDLPPQIRAFTFDQLDRAKKTLRYNKDKLEDCKKYKKILDGDHTLLYRFLVDRLDYEYEYIATETYS